MKTKRFKGFIPLENGVNFQWHKSNGTKSLSLQAVKRRNSLTGFTLAELITVVVVIAILLGVLVPALSQVKKYALEAKQKAQIASIEVGINMYKNDFGEYPPSHHGQKRATEFFSVSYYCGAQTLTEAMFGWDLMGVHQNSLFRADGYDNSTQPNNLYPPGPNSTELDARKGPYLDRTNISIFKPRDIFNQTTFPAFPSGLDADRYVICDVFTAVSRDITDSSGNIVIKNAKIGTPVLYFRADTSAFNTELEIPSTPPGHLDNIYNYMDNNFLIALGKITDTKTAHPLYTNDLSGKAFYNYVHDPMIPSSTPGNLAIIGRPVRPDTFLLISAGFDGLYGTGDDICNFTPNVQ